MLVAQHRSQNAFYAVFGLKTHVLSICISCCCSMRMIRRFVSETVPRFNFSQFFQEVWFPWRWDLYIVHIMFDACGKKFRYNATQTSRVGYTGRTSESYGGTRRLRLFSQQCMASNGRTYSTVVVCRRRHLPFVSPSVTDVLWLNGRS